MNANEIRAISNVDAGANRISVTPEFSGIAGLAGEGLEGKLMPLIIGEESDSALRGLAIYFAEECHSPSSPFRVLNGHYRGALKTLVHGMTRAALLGMFEMERKLRHSGVASVANSKLVSTS
jgi:hypothetical protein